MLTRHRRLVVLPLVTSVVLAVAAACGTGDPAAPSAPDAPGGDAGGPRVDAPVTPEAGGPTDAPEDAPGGDAGVDAACALDGAAPPVADDGLGETCTGYGEGDPCDPACAVPRYGYVCVGGSPPGLAGCRLLREGGVIGSTYCCPDLACVRQPDQDALCAAEGPRSRRFQCAAHADGGLEATPPADCREVGDALPGSRFYCCRP